MKKGKRILFILVLALFLCGSIGIKQAGTQGENVTKTGNYTVSLQSVDGISFYEVKNPKIKGRQPIILFFSGEEGQSGTMIEYVRRFADAGYLVAWPDLIGFFNNIREERMDFCEVILESSKAVDTVLTYYEKSTIADNERFALVGISMGGMVCLHYGAYGSGQPQCVVTHYASPDWERVLEDSSSFYMQITNGAVLSISQEEMRTKLMQNMKRESPLNHRERLLRTPLLMLNGSLDRMIPSQSVCYFADQAEKISDQFVFILHNNRGRNISVEDITADAAFLQTYMPTKGAEKAAEEQKTAITPEKGVEIENPDWSYGASDPDGADCADALAVYLKGLSTQKEVLFGHQSDAYLAVFANSESTVKDLTGDISALVGLDTLTLTGKELGIADPEAALTEAIEISKNAASQGAIITLSAHMPNFSSGKIRKQDDTWYFGDCTLWDAKNIFGCAGTELLPGGAYHERFCAYLDMIATYGIALQEESIPVLFRPFHEGNGNWFWWGMNMDDAIYKKLYQYTVDYLRLKGVHNFLYVYSVNTPVPEEQDFLSRYPGDPYVDLLAFDQYDNYMTGFLIYKDDYMTTLENNCRIISGIAKEHGKLAAISETGMWVPKMDGSNNEGLRSYGNPMAGKSWYGQVGEIARDYGMPYYLVWVSASILETHIPYCYGTFYRHEMADDFIDFYNQPYSIFAGETNFYDAAFAARPMQ